MGSDQRCSICGSEDVVETGPLTVQGDDVVVTVVKGDQCTLCGRLEIIIPQAVLVRMYPPGVRYLTKPRRMRLERRRRSRSPVRV